ncbi:saccharopine dehydrogenase family protein [Mycolicibacterium fortuitum]|uniref:Saccharopine dehydrogenase n=1 Tax=Mycolicibacterium fortuitum subsp. fortuitum DSM 46621 = ATCC 6841 = JCM 6387 TaxID=1214102 RepID=K0UYU5_MYCFO|nr:saccharopine dehydrogenase NADP-binding domain-containing protein [Mycolicibacterium fortuitum]AIY48012.1 putative membrane protein [Mycobacterium sp. VKM Ac-1817D]CRL74169.1 saccharopine dehydrogenase [Mycolicibacter nonchromogenicus]EJZ11916.1 saccharopine dehydrogenase [Mycolicibacterium fortuitum subsp. fortuitum DSM 46621 = ATCC 6841 = JCM 6387]WEV31620.1 saccharopine dehydrogenase NADP-binding domain-containing protein [Mycolicibacterium fortuitum]CRL58260.1 saccharopine dehydrogenase
MAQQREFDIVVYGATGFVGKLTATYLAKAGGAARIALAGRSVEKVREVRGTLGESAQDWPIIEADAGSPASLAAMAARTQVVVTTVGPYTKYGLPLVASCVEAGTDYADLTGETPFILASAEQFHKQAADTGARIVHSCGFDSVPSDLTVYALYDRARADGQGALTDTNMVVREFVGGASGGTLASILEARRTMSGNPEIRRAMLDPYTLSTDRSAEPDLGHQSDTPLRRGVQIAPELDGSWMGAFIMAAENSRIVRRSNTLLDWAYGRTFRYAEQVSSGPSILAPVAAAASTAALSGLSRLGMRYADKLPSKLLDRVMPKPGTGPSEHALAKGHYRIETYTTTTSGARYRAVIAQQGDPSYIATAVLLGESGLALALDRDKLSDLRGVLTPATAMGDALRNRLPAAGVVFETTRLT